MAEVSPFGGLVAGLVPPADEICVVRTLVRHRETLVRGASQSTQHMQKAMDQMNVRLHHAVTDITGLSGLRIIDAILAGERDPARLADLAHKKGGTFLSPIFLCTRNGQSRRSPPLRGPESNRSG